MKIGIDLGGTNLRAAIVDDKAQLVDHVKEAVGEPRDPETIVEKIAAVCERCERELSHLLGVAIGVPELERLMLIDEGGDGNRHRVVVGGIDEPRDDGDQLVVVRTPPNREER